MNGSSRPPLPVKDRRGSLYKGHSMLAIPVFRSRVAPVLNWCSTIHLFPEDTGEVTRWREIILLDMTAPDRLRVLKQEGVRTIVCGAVSSDLLSFGEVLGLRIIHGIAGEVGDVLQAYRTRSLDLPCYRLPGCRGPRHYRGACSNGCLPNVDDKAGLSSSDGRETGKGEAPGHGGGQKGRTGGVSSGPGGFCVCPHCRTKTPHEQGIPCTQMLCSRCERSMVRG